MRGHALVAGVVVAVTLALFVVVELLQVPLLTDPLPVLRSTGALAAAIGVGLLLVDVVLPVPSSVVMVAHGALFGLLPGALLSLVGGVGATLLGFAVGRRGRTAVERLTTAPQRARADRVLARWGLLAVVVTRPVPVLAETVAVLAGTSRLGWVPVAAAGAAGAVVPATLYAAAGATATDAVGGLVVFGAVIAVSGLLWLLGRRWA